MSRLLSTLSLAALLSLATGLAAQEATAPQEGEAAAAEVEAEAAEGDDVTSGLDMGREVQAGEPNAYIKATYDDWQLKCFRTETAEDLCQMYQLLTEAEGNPVAEVSIYRLAEGSPAAAGATVVVPLGTLLTEELKLSVDGGRAKSFAFSFCTAVGCFSRIGLTAADIDAFKRGVKATLRIVPAQAPDQTVNIDASLRGFTAAFENASVLQN